MIFLYYFNFFFIMMELHILQLHHITKLSKWNFLFQLHLFKSELDIFSKTSNTHKNKKCRYNAKFGILLHDILKCIPSFHNMVRTLKDNKQIIQLYDTKFEAQHTLVKLKWIPFLVLEVETHAYFVFKVFNFSRNMNIGNRNNLFRLNWASLLLFFE